jgi:cell division septum initiation protein DivIVA
MSRRGRRDDPSKKQRTLRTDTAERLEAIVEAAERAAESVIDDAEAQARRYLAQARAEAERQSSDRAGELSQLIDTLLGQAIALQRDAERLQVTLEVARDRALGEPGEEEQEEAEPPRIDRAPVPRLRAVDEPEARPEAPAEPAAPVPQADPAGARLLATQLAVSGSSREEIAERLRNGFEIEDTDAILDAILGPEG